MITITEETRDELVRLLRDHRKGWLGSHPKSTPGRIDAMLVALSREQPAATQPQPAPCGHAELLRRLVADGVCVHSGTEDGDGGCTLCAEARAALASAGACEGWELVKEWSVYRLTADCLMPNGERLWNATPGELHFNWRAGALREGDRVVVYRKVSR